MFIKSSNKLLNFFLFILSSISIIGALSLIPTDFASITKSMFWVLVFLIVLTYSFIKSKSLRKIVLNLRRWIIFISIILTFCWQFILVKTLSGNTWWDTSIVAQAASGQKNWLGMMYFSYYPNTFYLFRFEKFIFEAFNLGNFKELTTVLNNINIIVLDLSFVFLINAVKRIFKKKKVTYLVGFFSWILIVLSPYVVIFYSDTLGFFVSSLILYILSFLFDNRSIIKTYCLY
ncbi:glycosyltransferase family protein, partial [Limosilactobacillus reuteri]